MKLRELGDPKFISLETYRKSGEAVRTPVWTVPKDGKLLAWTQGDSWKIKRARNNPRVRVAKCDMRGNIEGPWMDGIVASISDDPAEKKLMRSLLRQKYPFMYTILSLVAVLRRENTGQVVVEIEDV